MTYAVVSGVRRNLGAVELDARWLRRLGDERLARLLTRRPEAATPAPKSMTQLAHRLQQPSTVIDAMRRLDLPTIEVAEAIAALSGETDRSTLDRLLGATDPEKVAHVDRALDHLTDSGLVITDGGARMRLVDAARLAWARPLRLGPPVDQLVDALTVDDLKPMCSRLGVPPPTRRADVVATLIAALRDAGRVRSIVDSSPTPVAEMLNRLATSGETVMDHEYYYGGARYGNDGTAVRWAAARGLVMRAEAWGTELVMPLEVALALRGPGYTAPFDPCAPPCSLVSTRSGPASPGGTAAGGDFLRLVASVLDGAGRSRIATIRSGGVGVRELRRLAKSRGASVDQLKLAFALAHGAGLLTTWADGATPTERYDMWLKAEPADRLAELIRTWWSLPYSPLAEPAAAWVPSDPEDGTADLRSAMLRLSAELGGAPSDWADFAKLVFWRHPYVLRTGPRGIIASVMGWRDEAMMLGLLDAGQTTDIAHALLGEDDGGDVRLPAALAGVGEVVQTAHLQTDLTAVVTGMPSPALTELLDECADREAVAAASTWRFSPAGIRRALATGHSVDGLIANLTAIAAGGVPQTLDYLIRDVARRHGAIRASTVACCLRGDDTALLAEVAADRKLRPLGLRLLAPTVIASAKPLDETLAALRNAGYAPVEETVDGVPVVEQGGRRRAKSRRHPDDEAIDARLSRMAAAKRRAARWDPGTDSAARALASRLLAVPDDGELASGVPKPDRATMALFQLDVTVVETAERTPYRPPWQRGYRR